MNHALALILACCALVAQDKPAETKPGKINPAFTQEPQGITGSPITAKKTSLSSADALVKRIENSLYGKPVVIRDELIELIVQLKREANESPSYHIWSKVTPDNQVIASIAIAEYEARAKAKTEAQRLLLQALIELAKEAEKEEPTKAYHSSNPKPGTGMAR